MSSAEQFQSTDFLSDSPEQTFEPTGRTDGYRRYMREARSLLRIHTPEGRFLRADEEYELAETIQRGRAAQAELIGLDDLEAIRLEERTRQDEAGRAAKQKLVECNLAFAAFCARLSMGLHEPKHEDAEAPVPQAGRSYEFSRAHGKNLRNLRSQHAILDDRVQVANLALWTAADTFQPRRHPGSGKPIPFRTYAWHQIVEDLDRYVHHAEQPGWNIGDLMLERIADARKDPDAFEPEDLGKLLLLGEGRETVPLELESIVGDDERSGSEEVDLTLADIIPAGEEADPTSDQALTNLRDGELHDILDELPDRERRALLLRYMAGLKFREIAEQLGHTDGLHHQTVQRGLRMLRYHGRTQRVRKFMTDEGEDAPLSPSRRIASNIQGIANVRTARPALRHRTERVEDEQPDVEAPVLEEPPEAAVTITPEPSKEVRTAKSPESWVSLARTTLRRLRDNFRKKH